MSSESPEAHEGLDENHLAAGDRVRIPLAEFSYSFSRSGGPGGQNVNKVNSKVRLRWRVLESPALTDEVRARLVAQNRNRITSDGDFIIESQRYRDQPRNIADCHEKLKRIIEAALVRPVIRRKTKPSAGSRRRRLADKRQRSTKKELRRRPGPQD